MRCHNTGRIKVTKFKDIMAAEVVLRGNPSTIRIPLWRFQILCVEVAHHGSRHTSECCSRATVLGELVANEDMAKWDAHTRSACSAGKRITSINRMGRSRSIQKCE